MNWIVFVPILAATLLLLVQGCSYLFVKDHAPSYNRCAGALTILLAALGLVLYVLLATGVLVLSTEFSVAMAQGIPAWIGLASLIVGVCIASGLGWHVVRCKKGLPSRRLWILGLSVICGLFAATRMQVLSHDDAVRCFDGWWPVLVIWVCICFSESLITAMGVTDRWACVWGGMLLPLGLALYVVHRSHLHFHYADPKSLVYWKACLPLGLSAVMALGTLLSVERVEIQGHPMGRWLRIGLSAVIGSAGCISGALWGSHHPLPLPFRPWFLWLACLALLGLLVAIRLQRLWRAGKFRVPNISGLGRLVDAIVLLALATIVASFADVLHFAWLDPIWDLALLVLAWALLLELVGGGPLRALARRPGVKEIEPPLVALGSAVLRTFRDLGTRLGGSLKELFRVESKAGAIFKVLLGLVLFVALAEVPNARKTIVLPFTTPGFPEAEVKKDLGRVTSDRIVNTLGLLRQELQTDMTIYSPSPESQQKPGVKMAATGEGTGGLPAEVKSRDVEIWGTKIPLGLLTAPIVEPVRWLLGVRVIHGSIQGEGDYYTLLAGSSREETWRAEGSINSASPAAVGGPNVSTPGPTPNSASPSPATKDSKPAETIATLADQIAYKLVSSDPALARFGMPESWRAIQPFREGVEQWKKYELEQDFDALTNSIVKFRDAVRTDPSFALAHYRLGRALTADGQPGAAAQAFHAAVRASPGFAAAHVALAGAEYSHDAYYYPLPPAIGRAVESEPLARTAQLAEARDHWRHVIRLSSADACMADRASAYKGLCRVTLEGAASTNLPEVDRYRAAYLAFFYCRAAEHLYARLSPSPGADSQIRTAEVLYLLGYTVDMIGRLPELLYTASGQGGEEADWHCSAATVGEEDINEEGKVTRRRLSRSLYARPSLRYYRRARALLPENAVVGCAVATMSLSLDDDRKPMEALRVDASVHMRLARGFSERAQDSSRAARRHMREAAVGGPLFKEFGMEPYRIAAKYYRLALIEYQSAIEYAPANTHALNGYAYTFWQWRYNCPMPSPLGPGADVASRAEKHARQAVRLTAGKASATEEATVRSTLGEVLLGQGRVKEAIEELEKANSQASDHAWFGEIRLDLAQAYLCRKPVDRRASPILKKIGDAESTREVQPFTDEPSLLDPARVPNVCR